MKKMSSFSNPKKVMIPCRFSFLHCWEPDSVNGSEPKYSVSAIIPKSDTKTVSAIKAAIEVAKQESLPKWGGKVPSNLKLPLRDGDIDRPEDEAYAGCYFLNANSREKPQVVDKQVQPIWCAFTGSVIWTIRLPPTQRPASCRPIRLCAILQYRTQA